MRHAFTCALDIFIDEVWQSSDMASYTTGLPHEDSSLKRYLFIDWHRDLRSHCVQSGKIYTMHVDESRGTMGRAQAIAWQRSSAYLHNACMHTCSHQYRYGDVLEPPD